MTDFDARRAAMVERQIAGRGIIDPALLAAMRVVPREAFVPDEFRTFAYEDGPLPIGAGQTISQPYIVALMMEAARVGADDRILEIGAGSGYAAAVMGRIAAHVVAVERLAELAHAARDRLARLEYRNVRIEAADGSTGWPAEAPYDAIIVSAAATEIPRALVDQIAKEGRLIVPVGPHDGIQRLLRVTRQEQGLRTDDLGAVRFVPFVAD
ncbi:protein-L-isoaspartate(D-aspartate) O-methyltransferase [Allosphingosinicella indica]|uniref:Protein-L-isoaspartate O-methyltransferase n=1 Tax=Allosphingosinicella indica TaxID=941907 RepID=A0A1X7GVB8_9SPHN|nr:protein-L-isoaspartate(D-aspartate) O-methyltransferase [Allosphingosinicella indica]SMF74524.1 protein-L-isoaspartate(D-aspartate) O-methyltransferase [Allosphingosinicella indica]